jgi:hypothetical protein
MAPGLASPPICGNGGWIEFSDVSTTCPGAYQSKEYLPLLTYTGAMSGYGLGQIHTGGAGALIRGGEWYDGLTVPGIFAMMVHLGPGTSMPEIGFRCVYRPYN